jgi:hypothetical protein
MDERITHYQQLVETSIQKQLPIMKKMGERMLEWLWQRRLEYTYGKNAGMNRDPQILRFLFGLPGSGVDWLAEILVHPDFKVELQDEPLLTFKPKPRLATTLDNKTYQKSLPSNHPLLLIPGVLSRKGTRGFACLIKQSMMLLHTEPLLRQQHIRSVFVLDDPVRILDRQLISGGLESEALLHESDIVFSQSFIHRFIPSNRKRLELVQTLIKQIPDPVEQNLLRQVMTIALIQHMFKAFAQHYPKYARIVTTEGLRYQPSLFIKLVQWVYGKKIGEQAIARLKDLTFSPMHGKQRLWKSVPSSNNSGLPDRLSEVHANACYQILEDSGLAQDDKVFVTTRDMLRLSHYYKQRKKRKTSKAA